MSRQNILASVLYHMAVSLKRKDSDEFRKKKNREKLIEQIAAMQFLTHCVGSKYISSSKIPFIISVLQNTYEYETYELYALLNEASEKADFSDSYEEVLFQMQEILCACILELTQRKKGYPERVSLYLMGFHNLPRAFLSVMDRSKISPNEAIEYSAPYLRQIKTAD